MVQDLAEKIQRQTTLDSVASELETVALQEQKQVLLTMEPEALSRNPSVRANSGSPSPTIAVRAFSSSSHRSSSSRASSTSKTPVRNVSRFGSDFSHVAVSPFVITETIAIIDAQTGRTTREPVLEQRSPYFPHRVYQQPTRSHSLDSADLLKTIGSRPSITASQRNSYIQNPPVRNHTAMETLSELASPARRPTSETTSNHKPTSPKARTGITSLKKWAVTPFRTFPALARKLFQSNPRSEPRPTVPLTISCIRPNGRAPFPVLDYERNHCHINLIEDLPSLEQILGFGGANCYLRTSTTEGLISAFEQHSHLRVHSSVPGRAAQQMFCESIKRIVRVDVSLMPMLMARADSTLTGLESRQWCEYLLYLWVVRMAGEVAK
ncbi:hypothetical protein BJ508DRAFT_327474 [Ascobolus immersus RN42]|uniref:Uncharacterized protein n=1 Tax=Ascobolus immersus RN42 TaxID=1160509 RepID=A0A3N4I2M3_ASCIM|nr:hypothetical protein BJ508DRAFT_327474 [Ascobolus immersus RN42]